MLLQGIFIGVIATVLMDVWAAIAKHVLKLPTSNWAMVGRWFGHMPRGVFRHSSIHDAAPISNELALGWIGHYAVGIVYGIAYLFIVATLFAQEPSLASATVFGIATLFAPWLILQPSMGAGVFASRTPNPAVTRLVNLSMHTVFGAALYLGWLIAR